MTITLSNTPNYNYVLDPSIEKSIANFESDSLKDFDQLVQKEIAALNPIPADPVHAQVLRFRKGAVELAGRFKEIVNRTKIAAMKLESDRFTRLDICTTKIFALHAEAIESARKLEEALTKTEQLIPPQKADSPQNVELVKSACELLKAIIRKNHCARKIEFATLRMFEQSVEKDAAAQKTPTAHAAFVLLISKVRTAYINNRMVSVGEEIKKLVLDCANETHCYAKLAITNIKEKSNASKIVMAPSAASSSARVPVASSSSLFAMDLKSNSDSVSVLSASGIAIAQQTLVVAQRSLVLRYAEEASAQDKALEATKVQMRGINEQNLNLEEQLRVNATAAQQLRATENAAQEKLRSEIAALEKSIKEVQASITHYTTANAQLVQAIQQTNNSNAFLRWRYGL